jgi:hypothetical protein
MLISSAMVYGVERKIIHHIPIAQGSASMFDPFTLLILVGKQSDKKDFF